MLLHFLLRPLPTYSNKIHMVIRPERTNTTDLARYMTRELINTGLIKFDNYRSWTSTFRSVVQEISNPPIQELDLLDRWIGLCQKTHSIA